MESLEGATVDAVVRADGPQWWTEHGDDLTEAPENKATTGRTVDVDIAKRAALTTRAVVDRAVGA